MKNAITPAMLEIRSAINEMEELSASPELAKRNEVRIGVLMSKVKALGNAAAAPDDSTERFFRSLFKGELRVTDMIAGTQSITYGNGSDGGFLVPNEFHDELMLGLSKNDPLLDANLVTLITSKNGSLRPYKVPGWNLSTFAAVKVAEGIQQTPQTVPAATSSTLTGYTYKASLDASFELEDDTFEATMTLMKRAFKLGFARGIGADLATGNGSTAPQGVVTGAVDSGVTLTAATTVNATDIENIYFALNAAYRGSDKCAWVMNDTMYQRVRKAVDGSQRPLIDVVGDKQLLMGKPILISPTMVNTASQKVIIFGDLSYYVVRVGRMDITRNTQAAGYVDYGKALYTGRMRADAKVIDPTGGSSSPILYATNHA